MTFKEEADEWLKPLGFSSWLISTDGKHISYNSPEHAAAIKVNELPSGERLCEVMTIAEINFITITSGQISFKHPRIMQYVHDINQLHHYSKIIKVQRHAGNSS